MPQGDLNVANQSGAAFRSDLNNQLLALGTMQSGAAAPDPSYAYQLWADTAAGLLKQRNGANNAWLTIGTLDAANWGLLTTATASASFLQLSGGVLTGNLGIGSGTALTRLHVGNKVTDDNGYSYDSNAIYAVHQTPTSTSTLNDPKDVALLARQGTSSQAFGAAVALRLSRYENVGVGSRTRLDFTLAHDGFLAGAATPLTLLSGGRVGVNVTNPLGSFHVNTGYTGGGDVIVARLAGNFGQNPILDLRQEHNGNHDATQPFQLRWTTGDSQSPGGEHARLAVNTSIPGAEGVMRWSVNDGKTGIKERLRLQAFGDINESSPPASEAGFGYAAILKGDQYIAPSYTARWTTLGLELQSGAIAGAISSWSENTWRSGNNYELLYGEPWGNTNGGGATLHFFKTCSNSDGTGNATALRIDGRDRTFQAYGPGYTERPAYFCRAWVNFDGLPTIPSVRASGNVSSVARLSTGSFRVSFTTSMPDANYIIFGGADVNRNSARIDALNSAFFDYTTTSGASSTSEVNAFYSTVGVIR